VVLLLIPLGIVALALVVLQSWQIQDFVITPGVSQPVSPLVKIGGLQTNDHHDRILLTDVYLEPLSALGWLEDQFRTHLQIVPASDLTSPGVPTSELINQGYVDMSVSKQSAEFAALTALGWKIASIPNGAIIYAVQYPSSAWDAGLRVADLITGVDGQKVTSVCSFVRKIHLLPVGTRLSISVERASVTPTGTINLSAPGTMKVRTVTTPHGVNDDFLGCAGLTGVPASVIGVGLESSVDDHFPGRISIDTADIGGPSAGLAMTLTLINELSSGSLTGGHAVAATGTISPNGQVGDVGGVAEKTIAVENAGASVFIVPKVEVATAEGASNGHLRIIGVTTLRQALAALKRLGGTTPVPLTTPGSIKVSS
jgi:PDZ domain-containing protein